MPPVSPRRALPTKRPNWDRGHERQRPASQLFKQRPRRTIQYKGTPLHLVLGARRSSQGAAAIRNASFSLG
jgi:hypothetical protein